jgi:hypothetical protein
LEEEILDSIEEGPAGSYRRMALVEHVLHMTDWRGPASAASVSVPFAARPGCCLADFLMCKALCHWFLWQFAINPFFSFIIAVYK